MRFDFDRIIDCGGRDSLKYDCAARRGMPEGLLPMWVADMDIAAPPAVREALEERSRHGVFGYSETGEGYIEAVAGWYKRRFGWAFQPEWLVKTPGVVFAIAAAVQALTKEGDGVLIQEPVYYPFREAVELNRRRVVVSELVLQDGRYRIDFEDFECKVRDERVKLFILCSPHNPVGRVWTREELAKLADICIRHDVLVVADEIHHDLVTGDVAHTIFPTVDERLLGRTVLCTAPSKTFNIAGLQVSNIFIPDETLRKKFKRQVEANGYSQLNTMGLVAARAAYEQGDEWLEALKDYLRGNLQLMREELFSKTDAIRLVEPEATYLIWMDCRPGGLADEEISRRVVEEAGLWLDGGTMFGTPGAGFQRINIAYPRSVVKKACEGLLRAFPPVG